MSREIKFRAWREAIKGVRPAYMHYQHSDGLGRFFDHVCDAANDVFMQFTGLKDKNGKEIYEGDLLRYQTSPIYKVVFDSSQWRASARNPEGGGFLLNLNDRTKIFEVIGNIHENPELQTT